MSRSPGEAAASPRDAFAALAAGPDSDIDLAEAALVIAAEEYPDLDVAAYLAKLDEVADGTRSRLAPARSDAERAELLLRHLFDDEGFVGNEEEYDDPRNSYLNDVLDRRTGIPISLSVVHMEVAARLDVPLVGVSFPGHFLVKCAGDREVVIDPFFGRVLSESECAERLAHILGPDIELRPELHLRAATVREILVRMLGNLKHLYVRHDDFGRALACCERILLLVPDAPIELRDRGVVYEKLECFGAALADFKRFVELAPDDDSVPLVRERAASLESRVRRFH